MLAAAFAEPGPPDVLDVMTLPDPVAGSGEVRVRIRAAGVQPGEVAGGFSAGAKAAHIALGTLSIAAGDTLLIHGDAGAVGTMAVQLAVRSGHA